MINSTKFHNQCKSIKSIWKIYPIMSETNVLGHPTLKPKNPVPSDIEVSQDIVNEVGLLSISEVAKE
jgi:hypothetical protein